MFPWNWLARDRGSAALGREYADRGREDGRTDQAARVRDDVAAFLHNIEAAPSPPGKPTP
jgi:hypothetical protein